jgi:peptide deformylase
MRKYSLFILFLLVVAGCTSVEKINQRSLSSGLFSKVQINLIMEADSLTPMRVLNVYNHKDSIILRSQSLDVVVNPSDPVLQNLVKRLYATVNDSLTAGVGIAAPQVGILKNIIWVQRYDKPGFPFEVYFNPKIKQYTKKKLSWLEGCLSIPGRRDTTTTRSFAILLEYDNFEKTHQIEMVEGFTAIIFQHEIDHLNGILYLDRLK